MEKRSDEMNLRATLLYAEIYLICMAVVGILIFWERNADTKSTSDVWLRRTLYAFLTNFSINLLYTVASLTSLPMALCFALKTGYHLTLALGVCCWCGFAQTIGNGRAISGWKALIPLVLPICAATANIWTHWLFEIQPETGYARHWCFHVEMGYLFLLALYFSLDVARHMKREEDPAKRVNQKLVASFPYALLAAWLLSLMGEGYPAICVVMTLELLCLCIGTISQQVSMDTLTQVNNRNSLNSYLIYKVKNHSGPLYLLLLDMNDFKSINDNYGHLEGDSALIMMARALKSACASCRNRPFIARYGGDEFVVVMEGTRQEVDRLCEAVHGKLAAVDKPYRMTTSIGVAEYRAGMTGKALFSAADEMLYKLKAANKSRR